MTNEDRVKHYRLKKLYRYLIIFLSFLVIVLESFALFKVISYLWGLIPFVLSCIIKFLNEKEVKKIKSK
ncbi:MAG: hypothetical protein IKN63_01730 [Bacilli bacterium]|nr:hypothetical protein [Bacilli bacterium]